jgi:hypothetical protein
MTPHTTERTPPTPPMYLDTTLVSSVGIRHLVPQFNHDVSRLALKLGHRASGSSSSTNSPKSMHPKRVRQTRSKG